MKILLFILFNGFLIDQDFPFFDSQKALTYLLEQTEIGPRFPGGEGHIKMKEYLRGQLIDSCDTLLIDNHKIKHPYNNKKIEITNYYARFNLKADYRIMLMAHWDTREFADKDLNIENRSKPIIGANDGASGVAVLLMLAKILKEYELENIGVDLYLRMQKIWAGKEIVIILALEHNYFQRMYQSQSLIMQFALIW